MNEYFGAEGIVATSNMKSSSSSEEGSSQAVWREHEVVPTPTFQPFKHPQIIIRSPQKYSHNHTPSSPRIKRNFISYELWLCFCLCWQNKRKG